MGKNAGQFIPESCDMMEAGYDLALGEDASMGGE